MMTDLAQLITSLRAGTCPPADQPAAADALAGKVKVKPLVWLQFSMVSHSADTSFGEYVVETLDDEDGWGMWTPDEGDGSDPKSAHYSKETAQSAAKAAAQADYTARILAALEPAPLTVADALTVPEVRALVEALEYILDGYGLNPPDFRQTETDEDGETVQDDWIVAAARAALRGIGGEA